MTRIELFGADAKFIAFAVPVLLLAVLVLSALVSLILCSFYGIVVLGYAVAYFPIVKAALSARGRQIELSEDTVSLLDHDHEVWRLPWSEIASIESVGNHRLDLITNEESIFSIQVFDQRGALRQGLISHLSADTFVRRRQQNYNIPPFLGWLITAVGVGILCWAIPALLHYLALARRLGETGERAIESEVSRFPLGPTVIALIFGTGLTLVGLFDRLAPRRATKTTLLANDPALSLKVCLTAAHGKLEGVPPGVYVCSKSSARNIRNDVITCVVAASFFGSIMLSCFVGAIATHQLLWAVLGSPYFLFVWWGLTGLKLSLRELDAEGWRIEACDGMLRAFAPQGMEHQILVNSVVFERYLLVPDLEGKNLFSPRHFLLQLGSHPLSKRPIL